MFCLISLLTFPATYHVNVASCTDIITRIYGVAMNNVHVPVPIIPMNMHAYMFWSIIYDELCTMSPERL